MELVAISDIYSNHNIIENLILSLERKPPTERVFIIAGDLGINPQFKSYWSYVERILTTLSEAADLVVYVPGDTDAKNLDIQKSTVVNINNSYKVVEMGDYTIGFFGLGGAVKGSVREDEPTPFLWNESIPVVRNRLTTELKINVEKVMLERPDFAVLLTHSPPYGLADLSKPITLNEMLILEEMVAEEEKTEYKEEKKEERVRYTSPRRLGSRLIRDFIKYYQPDLHIFGHVHKQGGKHESMGDTLCFNVSHLSPMPYKLTGHKFLTITPKKREISFKFENVVNKDLSFDDFLEIYV